MATFKVLFVLALAVSAYAVPMPRPSVVEATVQEITEAETACLYNGETYEEGSRIEDPADPCTVRFCIEGSVRSTPLQCFVRDDCEPRFLPGRCCPSYDHCASLGKFPQGPAEPHQPEEEVPAVIPVATVEEVAAAAEESKAVVEEAVEAAVEAAEEAIEAAEEAAEEAVEKAAEEEVKAETEEEEDEEEDEAVQEKQEAEEGSGLHADESDEPVEASDDDVVEVDTAADSAFAAQLTFNDATVEASGVEADDAEGSGFNVADFARNAPLQAPIEASGELADEVEVFDGSGDETLPAGATSNQLRFSLEGSGELAADDAEQVEGSGRRISLEAAASEPLVLEASGEAALDEAEGSGAQESEFGIEGEDLLTSK